MKSAQEIQSFVIFMFTKQLKLSETLMRDISAGDYVIQQQRNILTWLRCGPKLIHLKC